MKSEEENDDEDDDEDGQGNERKRRDNINDRIQELLTLNRKEVELIMKLRNLQGQPNTAPIGNTSAEKALGKIGVGPLSEPYFKQILVNSASASKSARRGSVG